MKFNISLDEEAVIEILHAVAESSCGYSIPYDDKPLKISMLHCCDYNNPVKKVLDQLLVDYIKDEDNIIYVEMLKKELEENKKSGVVKEEIEWQ